jgi:hypothetical protein
MQQLHMHFNYKAEDLNQDNSQTCTTHHVLDVTAAQGPNNQVYPRCGGHR